MHKYQHFTFLVRLLVSFLRLFLVVLTIMSAFRVYLFLNYGSSSVYTMMELINTFWLGMRLDASVLAYVFSLAVLIVFLVWVLNLRFIQKYLYPFFRIYFVFFFTVLFFLTFADLTYFSYFAEHSTLMIFGVFDDDTEALIHTALANYNVALLFFMVAAFFTFLYTLIFKILKQRETSLATYNLAKQALFFLAVIALVGLVGRGSVGLFPLAKDIPDVSADPFINKLPQTAGYAMLNSYEQYAKSKSGKYDLIKQSGFASKIDKAFEIHTANKDIDRVNLLNNLRYKTSKNEMLYKRNPHVVLVMVESFGMPVLAYQSESFNIMGRLEKHFKEDTLFTNFISSSNGTIVSLEPVLLNITARPNSTSFAQSEYLNTSFKQASAKVYQDAGYETSFVYGGDLSWRNIGSFVSRQGFEKVEGKASIASALGRDAKSISHDWGIFDGYVYNYVYEKLKNATKPQFIFILTTNNHPPYTVPGDYQSNSLKMSQDLKEHITGDLDLASQRFKDYAYALDMAGKFLDEVKGSKLSKDTFVAITADNNTVEGIMRYDDHYTQTKKVPFYIYMPEDLKPKEAIDTSLASSHKDIFPTLYNLSLYDQDYTAIGTSLLDKSALHCGFNDAGVIMAKDGGFKDTKAVSDEQKKCQEYYKATLAVTEYLVQSHK
ncbi:sulfatase-like hydrolase/transferase [bacterium]|nr:sulfatase-like hydrolase/transferase [bacterium]MBU1991039.1 sulfatase-like hydrolase/transferase [bacterium]